MICQHLGRLARTAALLGLWVLPCIVATGTAAPAGPAPPSIADALREQLAKNGAGPLTSELDWNTLQTFYRRRNYEPIWCDQRGPRKRTHELVVALAGAEREGLDPNLYDKQAIQTCGATDSVTVAQSELRLSDSFVRYGKHVRGGRLTPGKADPNWYIEPDPVDPVKLLQQAAQNGSLAPTLDDLPPQHWGYRRLRHALHAYQDLAERGGWPTLPPGPNLERGMRHPQVHLLRRRLQVTGDLIMSASSDKALFDEAVAEAVSRFQHRHGLVTDGIVGTATRAAANVSVQQRIEQLELNMERLRWLPRDLGNRYVVVNMAGFWLDVIENNAVVLGMPVIVGKPYRSTPTFSGALSYVVFNPDWTVPPRIANEDLVPQQRRNPDYFLSKAIRVLSDWGESPQELDPSTIDWTQYRARPIPFKLVQDPGPKNSLGRIKFMFANPFGIYLHDTPTRRLFKGAVRTHSSGCIRVAKPVELAVRLLDAPEIWTEETVMTHVFTGDTESVSLPNRVPIYLIYQTAWVAEDGAVHFHQDIYGRDAGLQAQLQQAGASSPGCDTHRGVAASNCYALHEGH